MLNRYNVFLLVCTIVLVSTVMADPPITSESYQSNVRFRPSPRVGSEAQPAPATASPAQPIEPKTRSVKTISVATTHANAEPSPGSKMSPAVSVSPGRFPPQTSQNCACSRQYDGCPHCRGGYMYGVDPFGFCVCSALNAQVANGLAAQLVFYRYDFINIPTQGGAQSKEFASLNPHGRIQLLRIAEVMTRMPLPPIVIESSGNPQIDEARRQSVIVALTDAMGSPVPAEWVVVDEPMAHPLNGEEAAIVHENLLRQTEARGLYDANDRGSDQNGAGSNNSAPTTNINR